jgi:hypothetical protein
MRLTSISLFETFSKRPVVTQMGAMKMLWMTVAALVLALCVTVAAGDINSSIRAVGKPQTTVAATASSKPQSVPAEQFAWYDWSI